LDAPLGADKPIGEKGPSSEVLNIIKAVKAKQKNDI